MIFNMFIQVSEVSEINDRPYDVKDLHYTHRSFLPHIKSRPLPILLTFSFKQKLLQLLFLRTDEIEKDIHEPVTV